MLELVTWTSRGLLGGALGWLLRERHDSRLPCWLRDLQQEDLVSRSEFDQYHHRVIQMSQVQKDYFHSKIEELLQSLKSENAPEPPLEEQMEQQAPIPLAQPAPTERHPESKQESIPPPAAEEWEVEPAVENDIRCLRSGNGDAPPGEIDPARRAIELYREGKTIDQIAQEMRIGRQEAQLLIRMAQFKSPFLAGV
ncbi:MAG: hypothetical protein IPI28_18295 [Candidatus Omnitrophica bacterium]|nr:hypothetical protein [Candidatus Omnitrophota bacterium]